jgi:hypothetical protein
MLTIANIDLVKGRNVGANYKVSKVKEQFNPVVDSDCYVLKLTPIYHDVRGTKISSAAIMIARNPNGSGRYSVSICYNSYTNILYEEAVELSHLKESIVFNMAMLVLNNKINSL